MRRPFPLLAITTAIVFLPVMANAEETNQTPPSGIGSVVASSDDSQRAMDYWTRERMRKAKPLPLPKLSPDKTPIENPK